MVGNGLSSSPSNTPPPYDRARFPHVTLYDNVRLQHRLLTERFSIEKVALVTGWSMGAQQTFQWGASYPEMVEAVMPFCGSARTTPHNYVFLEGVKAPLTADAAFEGGFYEKPPTVGLRAMARVYAGWGFSQAFYRQSSTFVNTPRRIAAIAIVMRLCLPVYALGERSLRRALAESGSSIRHQSGKPTQRPTLRWVFQMFQAVHVLDIDGNRQISNLTSERRSILGFWITAASDITCFADRGCGKRAIARDSTRL